MVLGKYCITELLHINDSLSRNYSCPDEYSQGTIDSLSVSAYRYSLRFLLLSVDWSRYQILCRRVLSPENESLKTAAAKGFLAYVV